MTRTIATACTTSGANSLSARPTNRADRASGVTRRRSWAPPCRSNNRFESVPAVPNRAVIPRIPGTNHAQGSPGAVPSPTVPCDQGAEQEQEEQRLDEAEDDRERVA